MKQEKLGIGLFLRIAISLLPIVFGMPTIAMILCAYNIAISFILGGPLTSIASALASICFSMFFFGSYGESAKVQGLFLGVESLLCAAACIYCVVKRRNFFHGVFLAALGFLVPSFINLRYDASLAGQSVAQYLTQTPALVWKEQIAAFAGEGNIPIDAQTMQLLLEKVQQLTIAVIPAILVIISLVIGYVTMWLVCLHQRLVPGGVSSRFSQMRISRVQVFVMALSLLLAISNIWEMVTSIAVNVFLIMAAMGFFAGMSLVDSLLQKKIRNRALRFVIHMLILFLSTAIVPMIPFVNIFTVYVLLSVIDSFADFRKGRNEEFVKEGFDETEK